jgi:hypothetical protein
MQGTRWMRARRPPSRAGTCCAALLAALAAACSDSDSGARARDPERAPPPAARSLGQEGWVEGRAGLWARLRGGPARADAGSPSGGDLEALGYAGGYVPAPEESGVTLHAARAFPGYNLAVSGDAPAAELFDMDGRSVHAWSFPYDEVPDAPAVVEAQFVDTWRCARLLPGGDLLAIFEGHALVKLDRASRLLWAFTGRAHHALCVAPDGTLYVLTRRAESVPWVHPSETVLADYVTVLSPDGEPLREVSVLGCFERSPYRHLVEQREAAAGDVLHTNALVLLDGSLAEELPAFERGNVLISLRNTHTLAVLDLAAETVVWAATGPWRLQHDPRPLPGGRLLLFDNAGRGWSSRVLELDARTSQIEWAYSGRPPESFFTLYCGASQRLANGNTLITESCQGRAFEVTPEGETVWSYRNPRRAGERAELIAALFDVERVPAAEVEAWLGR